MMRQSGLSIGRLAALTGVHLETIRYYERIGLMPEPARTDGSHRVYFDLHRLRLSLIQRSRELGFSIEDVRTLLALSEPSRRSCKDVEVIAAAHLKNVRAKLADLTRLEQLLTAAVSRCGADEDRSCPVLECWRAGSQARMADAPNIRREGRGAAGSDDLTVGNGSKADFGSMPAS